MVVGAGPWGLATAWLALEAGASVTVLDDGRRPAGHVAAGMVGAASEAEESERDMQAPLRRAAAAWPGFARRLELATGSDAGYRRSGAVLVAARPEHVAQVRHRRALLAEWDEPVEWLDAREVRAREPGLGTAVLGGLHLPDEHQVQPRALLATLRDAVSAHGGRVVSAAGQELIRGADAVVGVGDSAGAEHRAGCVVLAAGHAAAGLAGGVPVRPVKGQILRLAAAPGAPVPIAMTVRTPGVYLAPRDGEVVVGATTEERTDRHATAEAVHDLLEEALRTVPELGQMALDEVTTGLRPAAADGRPVIGTSEPGLVWAGGGYRNGVALTPVAAQAATDAALGAGAPDWIAPFSPHRFGAP